MLFIVLAAWWLMWRHRQQRVYDRAAYDQSTQEQLSKHIAVNETTSGNLFKASRSPGDTIHELAHYQSHELEAH